MPFISHPTLGRLVARTARQWRRALDRLLQPYGLTQATWLPLLHLSRTPHPLRQKDLASLLAVDNSSLVRILDRLQAEGLVERREGSDRRANELHLTAAGRATVKRVETVAERLRDRAVNGLAEEDIAATQRVLSHIVTVLSQPASEEMLSE